MTSESEYLSEFEGSKIIELTVPISSKGNYNEWAKKIFIITN